RTGHSRSVDRTTAFAPGFGHGDAGDAVAHAGAMAESALRQGRLRRRRPGAVLQPQSHTLRPRWSARFYVASGAVPPSRRIVCLSPPLPAAPGGPAARTLGAIGKTRTAPRPRSEASHPGRRCRTERFWRRYLRRLRTLCRGLSPQTDPPCRLNDLLAAGCP